LIQLVLKVLSLWQYVAATCCYAMYFEVWNCHTESPRNRSSLGDVGHAKKLQCQGGLEEWRG
jgi:hypothetical protein